MIRAIVAAALVSLVLVGSYVAFGGGSYEVGRPPDPCRNETPPPEEEAVSDAVERIALTALDGTACELGVSRERLLLVLAGEIEPSEKLDDEEQRADAFRSGLRRAIDAEEQAGRLGPTEAFILRQAVGAAPLDALLDRLFGGR